MTSRASASAAAAPPMSFFISTMPLDGLMSRPPLSKATPLPTSVTFGASSRPQRMSTRRGGFGRGFADGVDERQIAFEEIVAARRFERRAEFLGELSRLAFERRRAEIVGGRVDEVAAERDGAGDRLEPRRVDPVGRDQPRPLGRVGAVAVEAVEAEQERQRRQLRLVRRVGEAIGARRQSRGEAAGGERIAALGVLLGEAEQRAGEAAVGARQQLQPSRLRLEAAGGGVARRRRADRRLDRRPAFGGDEPDRNGVRIGRGEWKRQSERTLVARDGGDHSGGEARAPSPRLKSLTIR